MFGKACAEEGRAEFLFAATPLRLGGCAGASDRDVLRRGPRDSRLLENQRARSVEQLHALLPAQPVERDLPGAR